MAKLCLIVGADTVESHESPFTFSPIVIVESQSLEIRSDEMLPEWLVEKLVSRLQTGTNLTPVILVIGTMIGLLVVRNNHLSDRPRQHIDEILYKMSSLEPGSDFYKRRFDSLARQNKMFIKRYTRTCFALISLVVALTLFGTVDLLPNNLVSNEVICYVGLGASLFLIIGLIFTAIEFIVGRKTLHLNNNIIECWNPNDIVKRQ